MVVIVFVFSETIASTQTPAEESLSPLPSLVSAASPPVGVAFG